MPDSARIVAPSPRPQLVDAPLTRATDLQVGRVQDRGFVHDPHGFHALRLLDNDDWAVLHAADGLSARQLAHRLGAGNSERTARLRDRALLLLAQGYLVAPDVPRPNDPKPPDRVFNTWVHLTNACNLDCPYCYIAKDAHHMGEDVLGRVLDALEATARSGQADRVHVRFAGGEPMLRFARMRTFYDEAQGRCARHGVRFSAAIITNGTVVPPGAAEWLREHNVDVSVSIDGVGPAQDAMRPVVGGGSSFARLEAGLDAYQAAGITPYALVTVGDSNLEAMPELVRWLMGRNLAFRLSLVRDLEWGAGLLDDRHGAGRTLGIERHPDEAPGLLAGAPLRRVQRVMDEVYDTIEQTLVQRHAMGRPVQPSIRATHRFCDLELWRPLGPKACGAASTYLAVGHDGKFSACQAALHHPDTQALTGENLFDQARGQVQFDRAFARTQGNVECNRCAHKANCAGGCPLLLYRRAGDVEGRSPYCEVFRTVIPRMLRVAALELLLAESASTGVAAPGESPHAA
jgi:uncharacterized protein